MFLFDSVTYYIIICDKYYYIYINNNIELGMVSVQAEIESKIKRYKRGELVFPVDFRGRGSEDAIRKAMSRLVQQGVLKRLGHGIYVLPKKDPLFGEVLPSAEEVAASLAKKEHIKIKPAGAYALHKLGLSVQVPTKLVYLTDGTAREIKIGKNVIKFKTTTPKKMSLKGELSSLIIQALEDLGVNNIDPDIENRIKVLLGKEEPYTLKQDLKKATASVAEYLLNLINAND